MREDQVLRLRDLSEKLADVVLEEADPDEWPGAGLPLAGLSQQERGDRYWCKKNAAASFALLTRTEDLIERAAGRGETEDQGEREADLERELNDYEKKAAKLLDKVQAEAKKTAFDRKTHGKAQG
jgi:hypothetical protein